jgi:hypothetical protein
MPITLPHPSTRLARITLYSGGLAAILLLLSWITSSPSASTLRGWTSFIIFVFVVSASLLIG